MSRPIHYALAALAIVGGPAMTWAAGPIRGGAEGPAAVLPVDLPELPATPTPTPSRSAGDLGAGPRPLPAIGRPKAIARVVGTPIPGGRVRLTGGESVGQDLRFRWVQTGGPPVALDAPDARTASFTVPEGAEALGFQLVAANGVGLDTTSVTVPIDRKPARRAGSTLKADAGDDVMGLVGRQVTLNGVRSEPRGEIGYRWLQVGGPKVRLKIEDGYVYSFVPALPGVYRFALVVAAGSEISEPDVVSVSVGAPSPTAPAPSLFGPAAAATEAAEPTDEAARSALSAAPGGPEADGPLADAFEGVADRMDLYRSYADVFRELALRLSRVVPKEAGARLAWDDRLFAPMTARLIEALRAEGLDLRHPEAQAAPLTAGQRARLAEQFREMAEGFRAATPR